MDPSVTGFYFYRVSQKVSDVIPALRLTPIATQPSAVSVFHSVVKCGRVCGAQTCAHSGIEPSTLAMFLQGGPKVWKNFEFFTISSLYVPNISATDKNRGLQAAYVAFWPSLWKPCEICAPRKSYLECEWRVCVSSTDALVFNFSSIENVGPENKGPKVHKLKMQYHVNKVTTNTMTFLWTIKHGKFNVQIFKTWGLF